MAFEQNDLSGALFQNGEKKSVKHPDYSGSCKIGGVDYWVSAWDKISAGGKEYISLAFKVKEAKPAAEAPPTAAEKPTPAQPAANGKAEQKMQPKTGSKFDDMADDIPF